jgi:hypothetical protein
MKIFTSSITLRNGRKLTAKEAGVKCFVFEVPDNEDINTTKATEKRWLRKTS